ncbi:unnamed protein product [Coffea canephora]|uniref:Uncharacterized protein n=1 Tax=Coffea canephora TaxID=49390 RepID=A0A068UF79_COFCA|nr:unnamed protein product [Coffea canephora]
MLVTSWSWPCLIGLPNGGSLEDGLLPSDQRSGRRNRRQKCAARLNQPVLSEKENLELKPLGEAHDSFHAHQKLPLAAKLGMPPKTFPATTDSVI